MRSGICPSQSIAWPVRRSLPQNECSVMDEALRLTVLFREGRKAHETEIKLNEGPYETLRNGGTDAQSRCRKHLRTTEACNDGVFGNFWGQRDQSTAARHSYL